MLEAKLAEAAILKRLLDGLLSFAFVRRRVGFWGLLTAVLAIKELVADANFECNEEGIVRPTFLSFPSRRPNTTRNQHLQAMDNSHVALVSVKLDESGFKSYRCDRPMPLGVNLNSLTKVLKCAKDDDLCILKAADDADILSLTYEARSACLVLRCDDEG